MNQADCSSTNEPNVVAGLSADTEAHLADHDMHSGDTEILISQCMCLSILVLDEFEGAS